MHFFCYLETADEFSKHRVFRAVQNFATVSIDRIDEVYNGLKGGEKGTSQVRPMARVGK